MITHPVVRSVALLATALTLACGGPGERMGGDVDPYNGVIDNTIGAPTFTGTNFTAQGALAVQFQPTLTTSSTRATCNGATSCYLPQTGYANGQVIDFYNAGVLKPLFSSNPPPYAPARCDPSGMNCVYAPSIADHASDGGGGWHAYVFPHSCTPMPFDPVLDAFTRDQQFPIATALPLNNLALTSPKPPLGVVAIHGVTGVSGETCNDLKYASSIGTADAPGHFGAVHSAKPTGFEVWMLFDPSVTVFKAAPANATTQVPPNVFWFNGLQGAYLSGGTVPVDADGNLVAMDGVILGTSSKFGDPTANGVVLLPYKLGDDGYSPIVRLHDFKTGTSGLNAVCPFGATCKDGNGKKYVSLSNVCAGGATTECVTSAAFNTIFIVASPQ